MKKSVGYLVALAGTALVLGAAAPPPVSAAEITLKLGTVSNDKTSMGLAIANVLMPKIKEY
ncbi:MAG: hypothetical protein MJE12_25990, partial [Alphaproteobacteria bacterium]|nr:hypothetical protein [Alphaproteobacteria bacterium]